MIPLNIFATRNVFWSGQEIHRWKVVGDFGKGTRHVYIYIYANVLFIIKDKVMQNKCKPQMRRRHETQARWKRQGFPQWQTRHVADGRTADCIIYTHLLPAAAFGRYTCSVRLSEMIYDGPFAYTKRIDYWGAFPLSSRISPIVVESSILPVWWKSVFLYQPFCDTGGSLHLTTRYDWNIPWDELRIL